jgi:hypothetical protein
MYDSNGLLSSQYTQVDISVNELNGIHFTLITEG